MQIVYIGNRLARWGYTPTSVETLGERLRELGDVISYSDKKNTYNRLFHMLRGIWRHRSTADVVIIDTYSSSAFYYACFCGLLCGFLKLPYVPILHGGDLPMRLKHSPKLSKWFFGHAYYLVAPSSYLYQHFIEAGFKQTQIIPNYIDIQHYPYQHRVHPIPKILWVRSFHETYNPNLAIDILVLFKKQFPSAELCMVGPDKDGSLAKFLHYAEQKGVRNDITITGKLQKKDWIALSASYDLFLNTTNFDNTPVSVMEAMALGMLVVSTNAGGVPAIINHQEEGMIFPCRDAYAGADALIAAMNQTLAQRLSASARRRATLWDWQEVKTQWDVLLQGLAKK
jgi:glycosyltransferase involved in cell wall biosynthesis